MSCHLDFDRIHFIENVINTTQLIFIFFLYIIFFALDLRICLYDLFAPLFVFMLPSSFIQISDREFQFFDFVYSFIDFFIDLLIYIFFCPRFLMIFYLLLIVVFCDRSPIVNFRDYVHRLLSNLIISRYLPNKFLL